MRRLAMAVALLALGGCAMGMPRHAESAFDVGLTQGATTSGGAPTKLRSHFPEALLWRPEVITDDAGDARLVFPVADSITTWRVFATANTVRGQLGAGTASFRAFQDFFIEPDVPPVLTAGDRMHLPVAVFNYLDREQRVVVSLEEGDWYELRGERDKLVKLAPKAVSSVTFDVTAKRLGTHALVVAARGEVEGADAVRRAVTVWPDGRERTNVLNARVAGKTTLSIEVPQDALPGTAKLVCKCYPGVFGSLLDGLDGMLRKPHG